MPDIHPTALVDPAARVADDATIGAYSIIGPDVVDRRRNGRRPARRRDRAHDASGMRNRIFQFASIGDIAAGSQVRRRADDDDHRRRQCLPRIRVDPRRHRAGPRRHAIGNGNLFLAYTHVAHDCVVGNFTTFSNNAQIAGHVHIDDWVVMGAYSGVHQFGRVGAHAMVGDVRGRAAGRAAVHDGVRIPGQAARHQQRGPAPARLHQRRHPRGAARLQDAVPGEPHAGRGARRRSPRPRRRRRCLRRWSSSSRFPAAASCADARGRTITIGIVAGEASGDALAATLIRAVRAPHPDVRFVGVAGPQMEAAGCEAWYSVERLAVARLRRGDRAPAASCSGMRRHLRARFLAARVPLFIGVDAPDFNFGLERKLKRRGVRTVHFVSPSVWAWRGERLKKIGRAVRPDARAVSVRAAALRGARHPGHLRRPSDGRRRGHACRRGAKRASCSS